ncbi:MAG TPA: hypothetical protein PK430_05520 [Muribaculum sp.]|jgi:hypothetical protein|uniref:Uncharacterized protein n=1 Tax=Heminiphilus faecis TaxID=2601703 RepID=A0ABV4CXL2_9BACT|nr:hypothetical protein [Heminiphilus faecis]RLT76071.1 hypothetical protein D7V95_10350 [bacterium J10(2018)]HRF68667.1 hypothetical protein [Muribaculum sp.]
MSYYDKYKIEIFEIINEDETAEIVEERDTIFTTVFDRYDMESFQQISKDLALFGAFTDTIYQ